MLTWMRISTVGQVVRLSKPNIEIRGIATDGTRPNFIPYSSTVLQYSITFRSLPRVYVSLLLPPIWYQPVLQHVACPMTSYSRPPSPIPHCIFWDCRRGRQPLLAGRFRARDRVHGGGDKELPEGRAQR